MTGAEILAALSLTTLSGDNTGDVTLADLAGRPLIRRETSTTDDATAIINCDTTDDYFLTAIANATEFTVTGTPHGGQLLFIGWKDAGAAKALTFTGFVAGGVTIPTTTVQSKKGAVLAKYVIDAWMIIAVFVEA